MTDNRRNNQKRRPCSAWKRYGALVMAGALLAGTSAFAGPGSAALAEETEEERITLNMADETETEAPKAQKSEEKKETQTEQETETETETETEEQTEPETFDPIENVEVGSAEITVTDVSDIVERCMPSIVAITHEEDDGEEEAAAEAEADPYYYGVEEYPAVTSASGIIIAQNDTELLIATNSHALDGAENLEVTFTAEAENEEDLTVPAKIKGRDRNYELAVIAVRLADIPDGVRGQLRIAELGKSENLKVGQAAIAIGNSLGYGQSVTSGIISALDREVTIGSFSQKLILTDAPANYGNSGGALLDAKGRVIGINVAKEVDDAAEGMAYSIPIDTAVPILERLANRETRDVIEDDAHGYMGISVVNVTDDAKELYDMPEGAFVYEVTKGSAAEDAGIKKGDVITRFDGEPVNSSDDLLDKISYYAVGETVSVELQTANNGQYESREVEVTLQEGEPSAEPVTPQEDAPEDETEREDPQEFVIPWGGNGYEWPWFGGDSMY